MTDPDIRDPNGDPATDSSGQPVGLTRREALKRSGLTLGGLAFGGALASLAPDSAEARNRCQKGDDCCADTTLPCDENCCDEPDLGCKWNDPNKASRYSYFDKLPKFYPFADPKTIPTTVQKLGAGMRITFMGTAVPQRNLAQRMVSIFVEVGWDPIANLPLDQFVFDCGTGSSGSFNSMNVGFGRMNKIFLTHLHGDHTSDLGHIYCFGPSTDRRSPLWVWGPGPSGVQNPRFNPAPGGAPQYYDDGTAAFCAHLRDAFRWHSESFSFQSTAYASYPGGAPDCDNPDNFGWATDPNDNTRAHRPVKPAGQYADDPSNDSYALMPVELPFQLGSDWSTVSPTPIVAYENAKTGAKITAYPVIHDRRGSVGYKLEWKDPANPNAKTFSMIFTGDTKPERLTLEQARNQGAGVDVLIHEMGVPPEIWAMKVAGVTDPNLIPDNYVCIAKKIQNSSHTPQGAFGYLLSQISPYPGLTVATHFPTADDTVACAMNSLKAHLPKVYQGERPNPPSDAPRVTWAFDLMVITVSVNSKGQRQILEQRGVIDPFGYQATDQRLPSDAETPKYHCNGETGGNAGDPFAQINSSTTLWPCGTDQNGNPVCNYREDGY